MTEENKARLAVIRRALPDYEDAHRLEHTEGVYTECLWLSQIFCLDEEDAYALSAAALLHDITKSLSDEEAIELCRRWNIDAPNDLSSVLHQYTAAAFAEERFGTEVVNEKVRSAISCHTTGRAGMTLLDKLLFVADFTEPGRKYRSCAEMREYLHTECGKINKNDKAALTRLLDDITRKIIGFTVTYLIEKGRKIDAGMILAWNAMV